MPVVNHKVYLYKPDGTTFLGELIVDNLKADVKLQDISTVTFRIPEVINNQVNPRVDEVLDSYIIELWYGKVDGVYANGDFEKIRFRIYSTPLEFADYQYLHSYAGYSIESDLEFKQITSWPGIQVKDFFRTITYNKNAGTPRFTETGFTYTISTSSNTSTTKYITIDTTDDPTALDIFIYERRTNSANNSESEVSLIELASGGVNSNDFKAGYYYLNKTGDVVNSVSIALPDNYTTFNGVATANLSYKFYDNPVARAFAVGIKTNTAEPLSNMYIDLAQDAALGDDTPEYSGYTFSTQSIYSKNGLKLNDILTGVDNAQDGILYNTGFIVGTISNTIAAKYRSNIDFNNITAYQAIKDIAESFESVAVFNTVDKTVSFYAENEYGSNNGLVIKYATYLKSINKEIDAAKIITNARALGKDNIKISLVNPNGSEIWEDYSYFLDDYHIQNTTGFTIIADVTTGLDITYATTSGFQSRWMDAAEAIKVAKWQYTRDYFHTVFSNHDATVVDSSHNGYKGLYLKRSEAINLYVKYETQYYKKKADEYKYFYLLEHYRDLYENKGTNLAQYQYYQNKYNTAVAQAAAFKSTILDAAYENIYDETSVGSLAYKFAEVQSFLDKDTWDINLDKLRTFQREAVHNDSKVDNEQDLIQATKIYVDENKEPRVTFNISIIDVLEAQEAYQDWDKFVTGDKIYIYFPEFNIDLEAQIREISIDFQSKTLSVVISTIRNYNRSFGNYLTKNIRRFHNANMNTVLYYKDGTDASITQTEDVRTTLDTGINAGETSVNTGATDGSTGESSTTTDGEGQKSRVVTGVDLYTETLTLGAFTTGVKINDGRLLTFKPFDVSGTQWVQEVEVSAENGFVIRRVYGDNTVTKLAYIDATDGSAYFAGWELEPGQFSAGSSSSYVAINSQTPSSGNSLYAFWAGSETASSAPFSVTKAGAISAKEGSIAGLTMTEVSGTVKLYAGTGTWNNNNTPFYLDSTGKFSLEDQISWDPATDTLNIAGGISAQYGEIGGWTVDAKRLYAGTTTTRVELNADPLTDYAIFAGSETAASAPFSVEKDGTLVATSATITGAINATSGTFNNTITVGTDTNKISIIGAATAADTKIFSGVGTYNNSNTGFYLDATGKFSLGDQLYWDGAGNLQILGNLVADTGTIGGFTITDDTIQQGADTTKLALQSDGTNPFITIGQATNGYNQLGVFLGFDSGTAKLSLKSSTNSLLWDGTNLTINGGGTFSGALSAATGSFTGSIAIGAGDSIFKADSNGIYLGDADFADAEFSVTPAGVLKSTSGTIGGWTIGATTLTGANVSLDSTGAISIGSSNNIFKADSNGIYLGNSTFASAPFSVTQAGALSATSGTVGGWTLNTDAIFTGTKTATGNFTSTAGHITIGSDGHISAKNFRIDTDGNAVFSGELSAATGSFGNTTINGSSTLTIGTYESGVSGDIKLSNATGIVARNSSNETTFSVSTSGALLATDATITGSVTATSGTIANWTIDGDVLSAGNITLDATDGSENINISDNIILNNDGSASIGVLEIADDGSISTDTFEIDAAGNATFSGALEAATGSFGDTTINGSSTLTIGTYVANTSGDIKIDNTNGIVARNSLNQTTFSVSTSGSLTATDASVTGSITSTSGSIGGWNIDSDNLNSNGVTLYSGSAPYISIDQDTDGYNEDGIFIGIDSSTPKLSLKGASSTLAFDGSALSITGGSLTVGTNGASTGSVVVDGDGVYGYYDGSATPTFKLSNSTGRLEAVDIYLESGNKTAEIGNLTSSIAGDFGFEITNNSGYYIDKTDIAFTASTKTISSTTTDLSVYKKGNKITISDSVSNNGNYTVASNGTLTSLVVLETLVNESAGAALNLTRAQPYKVSVTDEGFFILTVDSLSVADKAMSVEYDSNRVWAKRLLISDLEDEETASVVIGTIAASTNFDTSATYGVITKSGDNTVYMTGQGFKIVQDGDITFKVETDGTITAETLIIRGTSTLGGWTVGDTSFESNNYSYTSGNFSSAGIKFNNNGTIIGKEFSVDSDGNAYFKGDLTAASGTFGIVEANKGNVLLGGSDPLIVRNNTTEILKLTNAGVLSVSGFTASSSAIYTGTKSTFASNDAGVYLASDGIALGTNSPFKVTSAGVLTASSGTVGGWTLDTTSLTGGNAILASSGNLTLGTSDDVVRLSADDATYRLWAGAATAASAPFRVDKDGNLVATAATITGAVTATSGSFTGTINANAGSFTSSVSVGSGATSGTINVGTDTKKIVIAGTNDDETTKIYSGTGTYNNSNTGFYLDASGRFSLGDQLFWDGTTLTILGDIQADTGTIGGFSVGADYIRAANVNTKLLLKYNANTPYLSIGQSTNEYDAAGIFLGIVSDGELTPSYNPQFSIKGTGLDPNYLKWDGQDLLLKGNLSGEISAINIDNVTIDANGIRAQIDGSSPAVYSFYLNADDGKGGIAGWEIDSNNITSETNKVQLQKEGKILVGGSTVDGNGDVNNATLIIDGTATGVSPVLDHANFELRADGSAIIGVLDIATDGTISTSTGSFEIDGTTGNATFAGEITADSGSIAGFTIEDTVLTAGSLSAGASGSNVGLTPDSGASNISIWAGASIASGTVPTDAEVAAAPFRVTNAGALTSTSGSIGGWTINSDGIFTGTFDESGYTESGITISNNGSIHSQNFYLDSTGITSKAGNIGGFTIGTTSLTAGTTGTSVGVTTDTVAFYAGNATPGSAPFRVENNGALVASSADITGVIKASSGQIGSNATNKWIIGTDGTNASIYNGKTTLTDSTNAGVYIGTDGISLGTAGVSPEFSVTSAGVLNASSATITGTITATDGRIGSTADGWDINANVLESKNDFIKLDAANNKILVGDITLQGAVASGDSYIGLGKTSYALSGTAGIYAGLDNGVAKLSIGNTTDSLTWDGTNLSVTGNITATTGNIGGFTLGSTFLRAGTVTGTAVGMSPSIADNISFYAGAATTSSNPPTDAQINAAPFRVTNAGALTSTSGNIGGFTISADFLRSGADNTKLLLKHDATNPFISIKQATNGYANDGIFLGVDSSQPKFSMVTDSGNTYLKYNPSATYDLEIAGNAKIGPLFIGNTAASTANISFTQDGTGVGYTSITGTGPQTAQVIFDFTEANLKSFQFDFINSYSDVLEIDVYLDLGANTIKSFYYTKSSLSNGTITETNINLVCDSITIITRQSTPIGGNASIGGLGGIGFVFVETLPLVGLTDFAIYPNGTVNANIFQTSLMNISNNILSTYSSFTSLELVSSRVKFRNENSKTTADSITIEPSSSTGSSSRAITLTTPSSALAANRTIRFPDAAGTIALIDSTQIITGAQTFRNGAGIRVEAASTQDAIVIDGRSGGTSSYATTFIPTTLTANRTITVPDAAGTIVVSSSTPVLDQVVLGQASGTAPLFGYLGEGITTDVNVSTTGGTYTTAMTTHTLAVGTYMINFNGAFFKTNTTSSTFTLSAVFGTVNYGRLTGSGYYTITEGSTTYVDFALNHTSATDGAAGAGFTTVALGLARSNAMITFSGFIHVNTATTLSIRIAGSANTSGLGLEAGSGFSLIRVA